MAACKGASSPKPIETQLLSQLTASRGGYAAGLAVTADGQPPTR